MILGFWIFSVSTGIARVSPQITLRVSSSLPLWLQLCVEMAPSGMHELNCNTQKKGEGKEKEK